LILNLIEKRRPEIVDLQIANPKIAHLKAPGESNGKEFKTR
jgi:hypothetical protein